MNQIYSTMDGELEKEKVMKHTNDNKKAYYLRRRKATTHQWYLSSVFLEKKLHD